MKPLWMAVAVQGQMDVSSVKRPCSHLLSDALCQKLGRKDLSLGLSLPERMYSNRDNGFHISHDNQRTITDSGISLLLWLWQEKPLLPPSSGQMSACSFLGFMTQSAWLIISYMEVRSFLIWFHAGMQGKNPGPGLGFVFKQHLLTHW